MPIVPKTQLQVGVGSSPRVRMDAPQVKNFAPQQVQNMGKAMQQFGADIGSIALDMQKEANEVRVLDGVNQYRSTALDLTYGTEQGYLQQRGDAAVNRADGQPLGVAYMGLLDKQGAAIESELGNDAQRRLFRNAITEQRARFEDGLVRHELQEFNAHRNAVLGRTVATGEKTLNYRWDDEAAVAEAIGNMGAARWQMGVLKGDSPEVLEEDQKAFVSNAHLLVVGRALESNNPEYARTYLEAHGAQMLPDDLAQARRSVGGEINIKVASDAANAVFAIDPDRPQAQMVEMARQLPEVAGDAERMALVEEGIAVRKRAYVQEVAQRNEAVLSQAQSVLKENGGSWVDLPIEVRKGIAPQMLPRVKAYAKSIARPVQVSSAGAYLHLNDVEKLTKVSDADFEMARTVLSEKDFKFYATQRAAYKEAMASGKGMKSAPGVVNMVEVGKQVDGVLKMLKIETKPEKMGMFERAKVSAIRKKVNEYVLSRQMAEGKGFTPAEIAGSVGEFVAEQVLQRGAAAGSADAGGKSRSKANVGRDIFTVGLSDISAGAIQAVLEELVNKGVSELTEEQVLQAYLDKGEYEGQNQGGANFQSILPGNDLASMAGNAVHGLEGESLIAPAFEGKGLYDPNDVQMVGGLMADSGQYFSDMTSGSDAGEGRSSIHPGSTGDWVSDALVFSLNSDIDRDDKAYNYAIKGEDAFASQSRMARIASQLDEKIAALPDSVPVNEREELKHEGLAVAIRSVEAMNYMIDNGLRFPGSGGLPALWNNRKSEENGGKYKRCLPQSEFVADWLHDLKLSPGWEIYHVSSRPNFFLEAAGHHWLEVVSPDENLVIKIDPLYGEIKVINALSPLYEGKLLTNEKNHGANQVSAEERSRNSSQNLITGEERQQRDEQWRQQRLEQDTGMMTQRTQEALDYIKNNATKFPRKEDELKFIVQSLRVIDISDGWLFRGAFSQRNGSNQADEYWIETQNPNTNEFIKINPWTGERTKIDGFSAPESTVLVSVDHDKQREIARLPTSVRVQPRFSLYDRYYGPVE